MVPSCLSSRPGPRPVDARRRASVSSRLIWSSVSDLFDGGTLELSWYASRLSRSLILMPASARRPFRSAIIPSFSPVRERSCSFSASTAAILTSLSAISPRGLAISASSSLLAATTAASSLLSTTASVEPKISGGGSGGHTKEPIVVWGAIDAGSPPPPLPRRRCCGRSGAHGRRC